jgi:hypothetical protein
MPVKINASTTSGLVVDSDLTGSLQLQTVGNPAISIDSSQVVNFTKQFQFGGVLPPAFSAVPNTTQTLSANSFTKVNYATEEFDTNNNFASSRFTPTVAGYYQISAGFNIQLASDGTVIISFFKNGAEYRRGSQIVATSNNNLVPVASFLIYLNGTTDYVETFGYASGTGGTITGGTNECCFNGVLVRAA